MLSSASLALNLSGKWHGPTTRPTQATPRAKNLPRIRAKYALRVSTPVSCGQTYDLRFSQLRGWKGPAVEDKAVWQFFRTHIDEESQTFSSSVSIEDDARFLGRRFWKPNPMKQAL
jgi:hypothetical protein